jgi:hypothetical protein
MVYRTKRYAQATIGLFPDVCSLTNCLIFLEKADHYDDPQLHGGCCGCSNDNRLMAKIQVNWL